VACLDALSQVMRLRVFRALVGAGPTGLTPGALAARLGLPASTLSFHLNGLLSAGLITQLRAGRHRVYRPSLGRMNALMAYLSAHCCEGADCGLEWPAACAPDDGLEPPAACTKTAPADCAPDDCAPAGGPAARSAHGLSDRRSR